MKAYFIGGCHVTAYPYPEEKGFVYQVAQQQRIRVKEVSANVSLSHLEESIEELSDVKPQVIVFQLGNFEFNGSLQRILKIVFNHTTRRKKPKVTIRQAQPPAEKAAVNQAYQTDGMLIDIDFARTKKRQALQNNQRWFKTNGLTLFYGLLYITGFLVFNRYGSAFKALNQLLAQSPKACIIFLTPFPAVGRLDNLLRKLGGWVMKRKIRQQDNVYWLDTHTCIPASPQYFVDDSHLTAAGHALLAQRINNIINQHIQRTGYTRPAVLPALNP